MLLENIIVPYDTQKFKDKVWGKNCQVCEYLNEKITIITNSDNTSFFIDKRRANKVITSSCYDKIRLDESNHNIIYCEQGNEINIYLRNKEGFIGKVIKEQAKLKFLNAVDGTYYFSLESNLEGFYSALVSVGNKKGTIILTDYKYIIKPIFNLANKRFVLYENDTINLIEVDKNEQVKILEKDLLYPDYLLLGDDSLGFRNGLISEMNDGSLKKIQGINYIEMQNGLYKILKDNNEGLWYAPYGYVLEPKENSKILCSHEGVNEINGEKIIVCASQNHETKKTDFVRLIHNGKDIKVTNLGTFDNGKFLTGDLIIMERKEGDRVISYFYNKLGNKILTIPHKVRSWYIKGKGYRDYEVYRIDGDYYLYKGYKLNKINLKAKDMFITGIRTELGDVAINEYDENEFNKWLEYFKDKDNLVEIGNTLLKLYNKEVESKYPNLVRRIK